VHLTHLGDHPARPADEIRRRGGPASIAGALDAASPPAPASVIPRRRRIVDHPVPQNPEA
jgi:hypothetical protein